ncbi:ICOS ligand [Polyodon spathula]|uniref:ICOS ligand n=1 Tax=Polyodon spathula TaxID=7913 RepID=UPI001B7F53E9|nr:ICOS ligand [Polyodon spathula]
MDHANGNAITSFHKTSAQWKVVLLICFLSLNTGCSALHEVKGLVGKSVELSCHCKFPNHTIRFLYMQKYVYSSDEITVAAYYSGEPIRDQDINEEFRNRTRIDLFEQVVELLDVRISDEGKYKCIVQNKATESVYTFELLVTVTAKFTRPVVLKSGGNNNVNYTCFSSGGYPAHSVQWHFNPDLNTSDWSTVEEQKIKDPQTGLFNVSSTITIHSLLNVNISCLVQNETSLAIETWIATPDTPDTPFDNMLVYAAVAAVAMATVCVVICIVWRTKKSCSLNVTVKRPRIEATNQEEEADIMESST